MELGGGGGGVKRGEKRVVGLLKGLMQQFGDWLLLPIQEGGRPRRVFGIGGWPLTERGLQV